MAESSATKLPTRYKSQRGRQTSADTQQFSPPPIPSQHDDDDGIARSKSRYRRKQATAPVSPTSVSVAPPTRDEGERHPVRETQRPSHSEAHDNGGVAKQNSRHDGARHTSSSPRPAVARSVPSGELFPPTKPVEDTIRADGPPRSGHIQATKSVSELPVYEDKPESGCFGLFKRKRGHPSPPVAKTQIGRPSSSDAQHAAIKQGGGGAVPGIDAPVSAVNAGDRRVLVECGRLRTMFPVTPTTTPVDLIRSAATCMSEPINVKSAVLLEYFTTVGVQRPLRRYEHIRDVMNSWDDDKQNSLLLVDPGTGSSEAELSLSGVPQAKAAEQSWLLSYSQKVGKWDRRMITLKPDGQIVCQKDPNKPKDLIVVCHLTDFDIYTPTTEQMKKKIKPPKKHCYAIKSQQKTAMFESTQNFVHFFSVADRRTADEFYKAVQSWRSWYLVHVMGEGRKKKEKADQAGLTSGNHRVKDSVSSHYQLGSFKPLIDMEQFDQGHTTAGAQPERPTTSSGGFIKSANQFDVNISPERRKTRKQHPPIALDSEAQLRDDEPLGNFNRRGSSEQRRSSFDRERSEAAEFRASGLLGRSYSQRKKLAAAQETQARQPFTAGPTLLNAGQSSDENHADLRDMAGRQKYTRRPVANTGEVRRNVSVKDKQSDMKRSASRKEPPKPLVDLTPQHYEPPHHARKGKGYHPDVVGPGGLIDSATSPENPLGIPPSIDWRNRSNQNSPVNVEVSRSKSTKRPVHTSDSLTGEGLLSGSRTSQGRGGEIRGRGIIDGSHAGGKPLLDVSDDNIFAQGSLLERVQREHGGNEPVIDRSK